MPKFSLVYTTLPDEQKALEIAKDIIEKKLAVCANIISNGKSVYIWEGKIDSSNESYMLIKTEQSKLEALKSYLSECHPYDVPAIISSDAEANPAFAEYMRKSLKN